MPFFNCFNHYLKLSFFRASPEQTPVSLACALKALILYIAVNLFLLDNQALVLEVMTKVMIELGLLTAFLYAGLRVTKKLKRFHQSFSSLIGVGLIVSLSSVLVYLVVSPEFFSIGEINQAVVYATLVLLIWNLSLISFILQRSLEVSTLMAIALTCNYFIIFELLMITFFTPLS
ncbi:MAG: hypothetical protein ISR69_12135 [Gammaproteobacteria bacterium]|nr:hypothetical protein [Gammaproteobacteria bacterium]